MPTLALRDKTVVSGIDWAKALASLALRSAWSEDSAAGSELHFQEG